MKSKVYSDFLALVRAGIGQVIAFPRPDIDWPEVRMLAEQQGLYAVVLDGIESLPISSRPPQNLLLEWIGEVLQNYEYQYEQYCKAISELAGFYNSNGYRMMVLKGYACSLDWTKPEHRPCGDIDIWQFGKQKEADTLIETEKGIKVDTSEHHHTVYYWGDFLVENHYDFINVYHHKSHKDYEKILKELGNDNSYSVEVCGEKVYLPSPNLHALFLFKHMMLHFSTGELNFRQVLDWAFFVKNHSKDIDWPMILDVLDRFGMKEMFGIINSICVVELGFGSNLFHYVQFKSDLKDRVLNDIISPEFSNDMPKNILRRVVYKCLRWKKNEWKHRLCYNESMWSAFWSGVYGHLLKPSSI